ncbi:hypothetical protein GN958_ATG20267 [Phytophthora infestans]|uniref:Uncharacterized protein n=1 Tax=Phytophthora infestans TaxID=4787 RepID=A0A8S9TNS7_PHYIN|nr:hypothetical protein GN958_ATG20267 [Phytophthora infestans]
MVHLVVLESDSDSVESVVNAASPPSTSAVTVERSIALRPSPSRTGGRLESEDPAEDTAQPVESPEEMLDPQQYLAAIPTRLDRSKIRHQAKKRSTQWHVPRSRKKRHMARCATSRSGANVYYASNITAKKTKDFLSLPFRRET